MRFFGEHDCGLKLETCTERLRTASLKLTSQRTNLIKAMIKFRGPFSADELFDAISSQSVKHPRIDRVTVFRCLAKFEEAGLVSTIYLGDTTVRYELVPPDGSHHHHIVCKSCKQVERVDSCFVRGDEMLTEKLGYTEISHKLEFYGICNSCAS